MHQGQKISVEQLLNAIDMLILEEFDELERLEQQREPAMDYDCGHWQPRYWETPAYHIEA